MAKNELILKENEVINKDIKIESLIYTIRDTQVMLDSDLATLYGVETKNLNKAMKRNVDRFPERNCFRLTKEEMESVRFQIGTSRDTSLFKGQSGGSRYLPYVYSEGGVAMLSAVLRSKAATLVSLRIIDTFIEMRKFISINSNLLSKVNKIEEKQISYQIKTDNKLIEIDNKFDQLFEYIANHKEIKEKIFYKGQVYGAYSLLVDLVLKANKEIILIDNYIDKVTLDILSHKKDKVNVLIYTSNNKCNNTDIDKFNKEYPLLNIYKTKSFHDRFLILDNKRIYLIGASIKDAGNKTFAIVEIDKNNIKNIRNLLKH